MANNIEVVMSILYVYSCKQIWERSVCRHKVHCRMSGLADTLQVGSELWGYLMSRDYSPHVVPLKNISDSLQVSMGMTLFYIRELVRMWYY